MSGEDGSWPRETCARHLRQNRHRGNATAPLRVRARTNPVNSAGARLAGWLSYVGAGVLAGGTLALGAPGLATACGCGMVVSHDPAARVNREEALVTMDGHTETLIMRLNLSSAEDNAALIVPTPTPATVSLASASLFDELDALSTPPPQTGGLPAPGAAPTVLNRVQLGPLEATTLTGGDVAGVEEWLDSHGYKMRPEQVSS
jgi:hypothetical protein